MLNADLYAKHRAKMGLTVGSWQIADSRVQGVTLRPMVGGFQLVFGLRVPIRAVENVVRQVSVSGARVTVRSDDGEPRNLGFARPETPFDISSTSGGSTESHDLYLYLQPGQLAALEALRGTDNLSFEFAACGTGFDENGPGYVLGDWRHRVSRSDWIGQLRAAGARDVLLVEVPIPLSGAVGEWRAVAASLQRAEEQYRNGDYHSCVGSCRTAIEELGKYRFRDTEWVRQALGPLGSRSTRDDMDKPSREAAVYAVLRHYTHLAHHGPSEGGALTYTRAEAQFLLSLTAAAATHARAG